MQLITLNNHMLAVNSDYMIISVQLLTMQSLLGCVCCEQKWRVNNCPFYKFGSQMAAFSHPFTVHTLVLFLDNNRSDRIFALSMIWVSTERQQFLVLHRALFKGCGTMLSHKVRMGSLHGQSCYWWCRKHVKLNLNRESMIFSLVSQVIGLWLACCEA